MNKDAAGLAQPVAKRRGAKAARGHGAGGHVSLVSS
jgi:hypothetical protein